LTDESGSPTSHLNGLFLRTILFLEKGIKPIWVFDGIPPVEKSIELNRRKSEKKKASNNLMEQAEIKSVIFKPHYKKKTSALDPEKKRNYIYDPSKPKKKKNPSAKKKVTAHI